MHISSVLAGLAWDERGVVRKKTAQRLTTHACSCDKACEILETTMAIPVNLDDREQLLKAATT